MKTILSLIKGFRLNQELRLVLALSTLAFFFKLYLLYQRSLYIDADEGYYLLLARNLATGHGYTFNGLPNIIFPPFLPLLIALFSLILHDFQLSLSFITAMAGTLLGVLSYLIARKKLDFFPSLGCFLLVLFSRELNSFLPATVPYVQVLYRGSDILNCFLVIASVYFTGLLVEKGQYRWAALAGAFLALAFLTRPEAFILFIGLSLLLSGLKLLSLTPISWKSLICLMLVFIALVFPYIYYLKITTGKWMLSGKVAASQRYRTALLDVIQKEDWRPFGLLHYSLNKEATEMNDLYFGYHQLSDQTPDTSPEPLARRVSSNLALYWIIPKTLIPLPLIPFFLLGVGSVLTGFLKKDSKADLVILSLLPLSFIIEALSYPIPRHHIFLVPMAILYGGQGAALLSSLLSPKSVVTRRKILFLIFAVLFVFAVYDNIIYATKNSLIVPANRSIREIEVSVSQRLKKARAEVVMSTHPAMAIGALSDWQVLPIATLPKLLKFAKHKYVDYAVTREEKRVFYHILDIKNSDQPDDLEVPLEVQIVETHDFYDLVRFIKGKQGT
jgi:4-amino-4-deoxy-L-arabinose transferase-like glycosyltransferase